MYDKLNQRMVLIGTISKYPVSFPGDPGSWDDYAVYAGAIIKENNIFKMFYNGFRINTENGILV